MRRLIMEGARYHARLPLDGGQCDKKKYSSKIPHTLANSFASPPAEPELMVAYSSTAANGTGLFGLRECGTSDL